MPHTRVAAVGAALLFLSVAMYVTVAVATRLRGRRIEPPPIEFAVPLVEPTRERVWDHLGAWTVVAVLLIALAYAYPIYHLLAQQRFGSPPQTPF
jgi:hypothetical protein